MKTRFLPILLLVFALSCTSGGDQSSRGNSESNWRPEEVDPVEELSIEQQSALDALNNLQTNTDQRGQLFSTFAGIEQPFYPPDTVLTISQSDLLEAMNHFTELHCTKMSVETRTRLASQAVLAQEEYTLALCTEGSVELTFKDGLPMIGIWVIPNVLGERDVVLVW